MSMKKGPDCKAEHHCPDVAHVHRPLDSELNVRPVRRVNVSSAPDACLLHVRWLLSHVSAGSPRMRRII